MNADVEDKIVMTLDAGGTNFIFSAMQNFQQIEDSVIAIDAPTKKSAGFAVETIIKCFKELEFKLGEHRKPVAISFSFPGPAEYDLGIIKKLENLPAFSHEDIPLGPYISEALGIPVFIGNDGDLFVYGEAMQSNGLLKRINGLLELNGNKKRYENLLAVTFGTGFGAGIFDRGRLFCGDTGSQSEINRMRNFLHPDSSVEYSVTANGLKRIYYSYSSYKHPVDITAENIFYIAIGELAGDKEAALKAFEELAIVAADALSNAVTLTDSLIVIGGGLAKGYSIFLQRIVDEMNTNFINFDNKIFPRLETRVYNLENENDLQNFLTPDLNVLVVNGKTYSYGKIKKIGIGVSKLKGFNNRLYQNTSEVVSIGAYASALNKLENK